MDTKAQLKSLWGKTSKMFSSPMAIVFFCLIGWAVFIAFFIPMALYIFTIRIMQIPTEEYDRLLYNKSAKQWFAEGIALFIAGAFLAPIKYGFLPFMYMGYWLYDFMYNVCLFALTLGKSGWNGLEYKSETI